MVGKERDCQPYDVQDRQMIKNNAEADIHNITGNQKQVFWKDVL